jgi:K+-sensing histidine kinase KdpD
VASPTNREAPSSRASAGGGAITNILVNAAHALHEVERPVHRVRLVVRADDEAVAVSISDSGPGIAPEAIERIFDPFYTTKRKGRGTGLGLSISRSILHRLGGDLLVESLHGEGATFVALIPRPPEQELTAALACARGEPDARGAKAQRPSLLVVDNDAP